MPSKRGAPSAKPPRAQTVDVNPAQAAALADPTRTRILFLLSQNDLTISQVASLLNLSVPTVHHHVQKLLEAGLIWQTKTEPKGHLIQKFYRAPATICTFAAWKEMSTEQRRGYQAAILAVLKGVLEESIGAVLTLPTPQRGSVLGSSVTLPWTEKTQQRLMDLSMEFAEKIEAIAREHPIKEGEPRLHFVLGVGPAPLPVEAALAEKV